MERGARVSDMRVLVPELRAEPAELDLDTADLAELALWARRWCPWTAVDGDAALLLDTSGCAHLFGGERAMLSDMAGAFRRAGLTTRLAAAPTIGGAWALARHAAPGSIAANDGLAAALAPLPVAALRLGEDCLLLLRRLGLKTIGQLAAVPREALVRRFRRVEALHANPVLRLDQAMGRLAEPLVSARDPEALIDTLKLVEPVGELAALERLLADLSALLCRRLDRLHLGARRLRFTAYRVDGRALSVDARTSLAVRDPVHFPRLFAERLQAIDPGFGIEAASLEALAADPLGQVQDVFDGEGAEAVDTARLVDRLATRLGPENVLRPAWRGSHVPERGDVWTAAEAEGDGAAARHPVHRAGNMPLRLLARPEEAEVVHAVPDGPPARFRWRRCLHVVRKSDGPERIAPEWWRERSTARLRDYYRVEDEKGRRFWMFREGIAGDGRGGHPRWFVHGLDA